MSRPNSILPKIVDAARELLDAGLDGGRVEVLDTTYYNSLAGIFPDPKKREFRDQIILHQEQMKRIFGIRSRAFLNTYLIADREIARVTGEMGYEVLLCDRPGGDFPGTTASGEAVFRAPDEDTLLMFRDRAMSCSLLDARTADAFCYLLKSSGRREFPLVFSAELMRARNNSRAEFWKALPSALERAGIESLNPGKMFSRVEVSGCPRAQLPESSRPAVISGVVQNEILSDIEKMEVEARRAGGELFSKWRSLTSADNIFYLAERRGADAFYTFPNPYGQSESIPVYLLTRKIDDLEAAMKRFEVLKRSEKTAILMISPETGKLPDEMGPLARYISGKSGGQGEVVSALCEGLTSRGIDVHLATLNLKKDSSGNRRWTKREWRELRYKIYPEKIHLVSSSVFAENMSAYSGNPLYTAAEFQREIVNNIIKNVRSLCRGRLIVHSHDWMAGGIISAYAKMTGLPLLHTVHNVFTGNVPLDILFGVDWNSMSSDLYFSEEYGRRGIDCQATAIKNASLINFVGEKFLREVVDDYFLDRHIIPPSVRQEVKVKYYTNAGLAIINAPSPNMYPENCPYLVKQFGPDDDVLEAKRTNRVEFQRRTGLKVDPDAIVFFWPSRLDPSQKGVELLEDIALKFVIEHGDTQIAIVADGVGGDRTHEDILGRISMALRGQDMPAAFQRGAGHAGLCGGKRCFRGIAVRALRPDRPGREPFRCDGDKP